eukprot:132596-Pleurochrysis_carterae.AAC.4
MSLLCGLFHRLTGMLSFDCRVRSVHSMMREPKEGERRSYEVYTGMPGVDSLYSGLSKRTPNGGFFTS